MEPRWGHLQVFGLLTSGPMLPEWPIMTYGIAACCSMAVQPLTWEGPACLPTSLADKTLDRGQTLQGYRSQCMSDSPSGLCLCQAPKLSPYPLLFKTLVARVGLVSNRQAHLWAWEWKNFQGCTERDLSASLGGSEHCFISLVSVSGWGSVTRVRPVDNRWWLWSRENRLATPRISKIRFITMCILKGTICLHMTGHLEMNFFFMKAY